MLRAKQLQHHDISCHGLALPADFDMEELDGQICMVVDKGVLPRLRDLQECFESRHMTMNELAIWFPAKQYIEGDLEELTTTWGRCLKSYRQWRAWKGMTSQREDGAHRAGAPKQHMAPWESSTMIAGMQLISDVSIEGKTLPVLTADQLCNGCHGVALCALSSWPRLSGITSDKGAMMIFPGKIASTLKKLGASEAHIVEQELIFSPPATDTYIRRMTTCLALDDKQYSYAKQLTTIQWEPEKSIELQIDLDKRWTSDAIKSRIDADWKAVMTEIINKLAGSTIEMASIYAWRPAADPNVPVWSARTQVKLETAERMMCSSGLEGAFTRPTDVTTAIAADTFTIVWSLKHNEANSTMLADLLAKAQSIAGHRGLARSTTGLGLRTPWTKVKEARALLRPEDPRLNANTLALHDHLLYRIEGCPIGTSAGDISRFTKEFRWLTIPQRRMATRTSTTWWATAEKDPEVWFMRWGHMNVIVHKRTWSSCIGRERKRIAGKRWQKRKRVVDQPLQSHPLILFSEKTRGQHIHHGQHQVLPQAPHLHLQHRHGKHP